MIRSHLKPPHSRPKFERLPAEKAMTVGLGFACEGVVLLFADTLVTQNDGFKDYQPKISLVGDTSWAVVIAYAGLPSLAKEFHRQVNERLANVSSVTQPLARTELQSVLSDMRTTYPEDMPFQQFLIALSFPRTKPILLKSQGNLMSEEESACIGIGDTSLMRFLESLLVKQFADQMHALRVGIYMMDAAKKYIDKCGGDTDTFLISEGGKVVPLAIGLEEKYLSDAQSEMEFFASILMRRELSETEVNLACGAMLNRVKTIRQSASGTSGSGQ